MTPDRASALWAQLPELAAALHTTHAAACEAAALAYESASDPLDVVASELWTAAREAVDYTQHVILSTARLVACYGQPSPTLDAVAARVVREHPRTTAVLAALDGARGPE